MTHLKWHRSGNYRGGYSTIVSYGRFTSYDPAEGNNHHGSGAKHRKKSIRRRIVRAAMNERPKQLEAAIKDGLNWYQENKRHQEIINYQRYKGRRVLSG